MVCRSHISWIISSRLMNGTSLEMEMHGNLLTSIFIISHWGRAKLTEDRKVIEMSKEDLPFIHFSRSSELLLFHWLLMCFIPYFRISLLLRQMEEGWIKAGRDTGKVFAVISSGPSSTSCHSKQRNVIFFIFLILAKEKWRS